MVCEFAKSMCVVPLKRPTHRSSSGHGPYFSFAEFTITGLPKENPHLGSDSRITVTMRTSHGIQSHLGNTLLLNSLGSILLSLTRLTVIGPWKGHFWVGMIQHSLHGLIHLDSNGWFAYLTSKSGNQSFLFGIRRAC